MKYLLPALSILSFLSCNNEQDLSFDYHAHILSPDMSKQLEKLGDTILPSIGHDIVSVQGIPTFDRTVLLSMAYMASMNEFELDDRTQKELTRSEDQFTVTQAAASEKLHAFFSVNPLSDVAIEEAKYWKDKDEVSGLKLHLANSSFDYFDPTHLNKLQSIIELVDDPQMTILIHLRNRNPEYGSKEVEVFLDKILPLGPHSTWIIAHAGGWGGYDEATDQALAQIIKAIQSKTIENEEVYLDVSAVIVTEEAKKYFPLSQEEIDLQAKIFMERFRTLELKHWLFGSDWIPNDTESPAKYFNALIAAGFTKEEMQQLSYSNFHLLNNTDRNTPSMLLWL